MTPNEEYGRQKSFVHEVKPKYRWISRFRAILRTHKIGQKSVWPIRRKRCVYPYLARREKKMKKCNAQLTFTCGEYWIQWHVISSHNSSNGWKETKPCGIDHDLMENQNERSSDQDDPCHHLMTHSNISIHVASKTMEGFEK